MKCIRYSIDVFDIIRLGVGEDKEVISGSFGRRVPSEVIGDGQARQDVKIVISKVSAKTLKGPPPQPQRKIKTNALHPLISCDRLVWNRRRHHQRGVLPPNQPTHRVHWYLVKVCLFVDHVGAGYFGSFAVGRFVSQVV